jgi:class 3 adenylate cyclase/predicted ATPase/energy-coupling factor transporter ATP-binding protein EcfA2
MTFDEVLAQVQELLQREKRVSYRGLKRRFALDDEYLEDLKEELIGAKRVATDEDGRFLVWTGASSVSGSEFQAPSFPQSPAPSPQHPEAERRQLTVMFCDLVGSTTLSAQLDPEEYRELMRAYQETCAQVIHRFAGHIAQYLGDGLLVYFGYPAAHEDDAARAVRAGLGIVEALRALNPRLLYPLQVRIGIHTGAVVVGTIGGGSRQEQLALGETPNVAARIQGQAAPNEVMISAATSRLVEGLFECEDRGRPELKGASTSLTLYRVIKEEEAQSRFQVVARKGLTPLVGREHEHGLLQERWERVKDGTGQVVLLSGEPGIGKSRLVEVLKEAVEREGTPCLELRCSPYAQNSALQPVIEHLQRQLQLRPDDPPETNVEKLHQALRRSRFCQADTLPLLAALLSLPHPPEVPPLTLSPQKQKEKTYEAVVAWLCEEAQQHAVTYAWEDLHWADPSTLELLTLFLAQIPTTPLLAVLTFRPEFTPPWGGHSYLSQLTLSRLGRSQVETMVRNVTGGKALPAEVIQQIVSKTDGVPLFVEELTKMVMESDLVREVDGHYELNGPLPPLAIPSTLQDSLMARLDRLATVREIAQISATLGREFDYALLRAVSPLNEDALQQGLRQLVETELVYQNGIPPQARYLFKHALVQDAAYQSLLKSRRQQLHQQVAQVLEEQFPETVESQPELVAHHYTEAGLIEQAIPYWQRAGELAGRRVALKEAIAHLNQGMALIGMLPPSSERDGHELDLRTRLGMDWLALKGWGGPEVWTSLHPALGLAKSLGRHDALLPIYWGLWSNVLDQGRVAASLDWANETLVMAEASGEPALFILGHWAACVTHFWRGDVIQSRVHGDRMLALYRAEQHRHLTNFTNQDPQTSVGLHTSLGSWLLGYPDRAVHESEVNETHARQLGQPFNLGATLIVGGLLWDCRCEPMSLLARVEEGEQLGHVHSLPFISDVLAQIMKGVAWLRAGRLAEGIPQLRSAMETRNVYGGELWMPYWRAVLAEGLALNSDPAGGLRLIEESLAQIVRPGWESRWSLAETLRLKGWMLLLQSDRASAEENYFASLDVAREQQAKSWELRTSTSLARLWQQQGKRREARTMLAEIYGWFTEGFDTKDLQEAKALLDQLN